MATLAEVRTVLGAEDFAFLEHLAFEAEVPVLDGLQAQGDLIIVPRADAGRPLQYGPAVPVTAAGIAVIEAVGGGHEHRLFASVPDTATFSPISGWQDIGLLECTAPAYVLHPEHGAAGIAPGAYVLRRQREQAEEQRLVAD